MVTIRHQVDVEGGELNTLDGLAFALEIREAVGAPAGAHFGASPGRLTMVWREQLELDTVDGEGCEDDCERE